MSSLDRADFGKVGPADPMTFEEAGIRFRGCAEFAGWPKAKTEGIIGFVRNLDCAGDMSALAPLLAVEKR